MNFHTIFVNQTLINKVHDLCNKYGLKSFNKSEVNNSFDNKKEEDVFHYNSENEDGEDEEIKDIKESEFHFHFDNEENEENEDKENEDEDIKEPIYNTDDEVEYNSKKSSNEINEKLSEHSDKIDKIDKITIDKTKEYFFNYRVELENDEDENCIEVEYEDEVYPITFNNNKNDKNKKEKKNVYITLYDEHLIFLIRELLDDAELNSDEPHISIQSLYWSINDMRIKNKEDKEYQCESFEMFLKFTEDLFNVQYSTMDNMIKKNIISFESLWYYFDKIDTLYTFKYNGENICCKHNNFFYTESVAGILTKFSMIGNIITFIHGKPKMENTEFIIHKFTNTKSLDEFKIKKTTELEVELFNKYSSITLNLATGYHHRFVDGACYSKSSTSDEFIKRNIKERVMVDQVGFEKNGYKHSLFDNTIDFDLNDMKEKEKDKCIIFPFLYVYNLSIDKYWGLVHVNYISPIEFQENAFKCLVLEENKKDLIKALINNRTVEYKDFITNKGNNTIFLLSGTPGVGKTLTAEAVAEYLKLPLYNVSVGDLGTNPEQMESILSRIFKMTESWNAIVLIDEADIFLEERCDFNIVHNAMVSTFMKILDYNNCIIFLTTNRLKSIDSAVKSRINLLLHYEDLTSANRSEIWKGLLNKWEIKLKNETINELSDYKINGREIRNYIKTIISIHKEKNNMVITDQSILEHMKKIYDIFNEFDKNLCSHSLYM